MVQPKRSCEMVNGPSKSEALQPSIYQEPQSKCRDYLPYDRKYTLVECTHVPRGEHYYASKLSRHPFVTRVMTVDDTRQNYIKENYKAYLEGRGRLEWFLRILGENPSAQDRESVELVERELGIMTQSQIEKSKKLRALVQTP